MSLATNVVVKMFVFVLFCLLSVRADDSVKDEEKIGKRVKRWQVVTQKTVTFPQEIQGFLPGTSGHGKVLRGCKDAKGHRVGYDKEFTRHFHGQCYNCHCVRPGVIAFHRMTSCKRVICAMSPDAFKGCKKIVRRKGKCCRECDDKQFIIGAPTKPSFTFPPIPGGGGFPFPPLPLGGGGGAGHFTFPPIHANGLGGFGDEVNNDQSKDVSSSDDIKMVEKK